MKTLEEQIADARHWQCDCGEWCDPVGSAWRWNGRAWEHAHNVGGHYESERKVRKVAYHTGDGWYLHEIGRDGEIVNEEGLEWPEGWP